MVRLFKKGRRLKRNMVRYQLKARKKASKLEWRFRRHPYVLPFSLVIMLMVVGGLLLVVFNRNQTISSSDSRIIRLYVDHESSVVPTREATVGDFIKKAEIKLADGDVVEPSLDTEITEDNFHINVYRAAPVVVFDGDQKTFALSAALTPRSIAEQVGIVVFPEDEIKTEPSDDFLRDGGIGHKVTIDRATPANLNLYGSAHPVRSQATTVGDLLKEKQVQLAPDDQVIPAPDTPLTDGLQVFVTRFGVQVTTVEESIPASTETVEDSSLSFGATAVRQQGSPGKKTVTFEIKLENGKEVSRKVIQEVVTQAPVTRIVVRGKAVSIPSDKEAIMRAAGIASSDFPYVHYIINHENASWCPTRWQGTNGCPAYYQEKFPGAESNTKVGYGLCQSTPANKMASAGDDWRTNPVTQLKWCSGYAIGRYGSWANAYNFWVSHKYW